MAIEKKTTDTFILNSYEQGEHDMALKLFTREFGLLYGVAKSVRKLESKLRPHLRTGRFSRITLVQGREVWRIVGAESVSLDGEFRAVACQLLERFVRGATPQKKLFDHIISFLSSDATKLPRERAILLLYYLILVDLGYADARVGGAESSSVFFAWSITDHVTHLMFNHDRVRTHVHTVLKEMQL